MENKINLGNLKKFVGALKALPPTVINMSSSDNPLCGTPGCFAGLISMTDLEDLKHLYACEQEKSLFLRDPYDYSDWGAALAIYLGFSGKIEMQNWAEENPLIWGNSGGGSMFSWGLAFGQVRQEFSHLIIVEHWAKVLERLESEYGIL